MPLSNAEKQANRRKRWRAEGRKAVTLQLLPGLHAKLTKQAKRKGRTLIGHIEAVLKGE